MSFAGAVEKQIKDHYKGGYIAYIDLIKYLKNGRIDKNTNSIHATNSGYDTSYDNSMIILYFSDNSALVVAPNSIISVKVS